MFDDEFCENWYEFEFVWWFLSLLRWFFEFVAVVTEFVTVVTWEREKILLDFLVMCH
jgi:hypothetical protein